MYKCLRIISSSFVCDVAYVNRLSKVACDFYWCLFFFFVLDAIYNQAVSGGLFLPAIFDLFPNSVGVRCCYLLPVQLIWILFAKFLFLILSHMLSPSPSFFVYVRCSGSQTNAINSIIVFLIQFLVDERFLFCIVHNFIFQSLSI